jgi:hypothetical protein
MNKYLHEEHSLFRMSVTILWQVNTFTLRLDKCRIREEAPRVVRHEQAALVNLRRVGGDNKKLSKKERSRCQFVSTFRTSSTSPGLSHGLYGNDLIPKSQH